MYVLIRVQPFERTAFRPLHWYAGGVRSQPINATFIIQVERIGRHKWTEILAAECCACDRRREKLNFYMRTQLSAIELILDAKSTILGVLSAHQGEPEYAYSCFDYFIN